MLWFFSHMRDLDPLQHRLDAFIHFAQWFADITAVGLIALTSRCNARGDEKWAINSLDDLKGGNSVCRSGQRVSTIGPVLRLKEPSPRQPLQNLRQRLRGNAIGIGNVLGAPRTQTGALGKVLHCHEGVVGFFRQL